MRYVDLALERKWGQLAKSDRKRHILTLEIRDLIRYVECPWIEAVQVGLSGCDLTVLGPGDEKTRFGKGEAPSEGFLRRYVINQ